MISCTGVTGRACIPCNQGVELRLALYRQEIEVQAKAELARQVERIRELEVSAARLDEASKARR